MQTPTELPLRDIQLPEPIGWWPLAPGWWLLLALIILIISAVWWYRRYSAQHRRRKQVVLALRSELQQIRARIDQQHHRESLRELSVLLRRACLSFFTREQVASLTGSVWTDFIIARSGIARDDPCIRLLTEERYRPDLDIDRDSLSCLIDLLEASFPALASESSR